MPSVTVPRMDIHYANIGTSPVVNPSALLLVIDGVNYSSSKSIDTGTYQRYFFPVYNTATNYIQVACLTVTYAGDAPAESFNNIEVYTLD